MRKISTLLIAIILLVSAQSALAQNSSDDTIAIITAPTENQAVTGEVLIVGSASHPSLYAGYELDFDSLADANEIWIPIGSRITQPVSNSSLGVWDTVGQRIPDGSYQLRLRVFLTDGSDPVEFRVRNIQVQNTAPTALPTDPPQLPSPTPLENNTGDTSVTPTPLIVQPATSTPNSSSSTVVGTDGSSSGTSTTDDERSLTVNFDSIQSAFCSGIYIGIVGFILFGIYLAFRARIRPAARQVWWQIRNEFDQDR